MSSTQQEIKVARKRAGMGAPTVQIQTTPAGSRMSMGVPGMTVRRTTNVLRQSMGPAYVSAPGEATRISKNAVDTICDNRGKEKSEMSELNTRLARHLEETRFHKATIQALTDELQKWKDLKGLDDKRLRDEFVEELREARESLTGLKDTIAEKEARILSLEDMLDTKNAEVDAIKGQREELLAEISRLTNMISGLEGELNSTRRSVENAEREKKLLQEDLARLRADNDRIREDCEAARCKQIEATHQRDALDEQLAFEMESYEIENDSLRELIKELQKMTPKIQEKWSSDFKELVAAIQGDYAERVAIKEDECRRRYEDQLIMIQNSIPRDNTDQIQKSENKTLKSSLSKNKALISDLERENARLEALLAQIRRERDEECEECERDKARLKAEWDKANDELQQVADTLRTLQDKNLDLELEISCYRKLLEGEERQMARNLEDYSQMQSAGGAMLASAISGGGRGGRGGGSGGGAQTSQSSS